MADGEPRKVPISGKIDASTRDALKQISEASPFKPTLSRLVEMAIEEFVERHAPKPARKKAG